MKILLLASSGKFVTERASEFLSRPLAEMKIAYITTASYGVPDRSYIEEHVERRAELGWDMEEVDLAGKNEEQLRKAFAGKDVIYVEGGNTFYLMKAIRESGFDKVLREFLGKGVIYIGTSAGSYVCSPTIEAATWKHQDKYDHFGVTDFAGMNLVPFLITAHFEPKFRRIIAEKSKETQYPVRILTDEQALLVRDDNIRLVGSGEEVRV